MCTGPYSFIVFFCFQWEQKLEKGQEDFEKISEIIRKEVKFFEVCRVADFKAAVITYLEHLMETQQKVSNAERDLGPDHYRAVCTQKGREKSVVLLNLGTVCFALSSIVMK